MPGLIAIIIIIMAAVLLRRRKKPVDGEKDSETENNQTGQPSTVTDPEPEENATGVLPIIKDYDPRTRPLEKAKEEEKEFPGNIPAGNTRSVLFTAVGHDRIRIALKIEEGKSLTLGRDSRADLILNPDDKKLSGVHCLIRIEQDQLLVKDAGSTNGTAVNGVPLYGSSEIRMSEGDTLHVGGYEYRLHFE